MKNIAEILEGVKTMGIGGHIRPDGDCVGSCMALYLYVKTYYPEIQVDVYLDNPKPVFGHIDCMDEIKTEFDGDKEYDLFVTCEVRETDLLLQDHILTQQRKQHVSIIISAILDLHRSTTSEAM